MDGFTISFLLVTACAFLLSGAIKGLTGVGLPTPAIALMTLMVAPRTAIAIVLFPMLVSNAWQVFRSGDFKGAILRYKWFIAISALGVWVVANYSANVSDRLMFGASGVVILFFVAVNLSFSLPPLPQRFDRIAQLVFGAVAGIIGGLTSMWAAPIAIYLTARQTSKDEFVRASGLLIFLASIPLCLGYIRQGFLTGELAVVSTVMIIPALAGFATGEVVRHRLSPVLFRKIVLYFFLILGLNLIRRAIWGA